MLHCQIEEKEKKTPGIEKIRSFQKEDMEEQEA
jgi:hypothetical protein